MSSTTKMAFKASNVSVSKLTDAFANLSYEEPASGKNKAVSFKFKDAYSHFGVTEGKNPFNGSRTFSIAISLSERQAANLNALETRCDDLLPEGVQKGEGKRLMKALYKKEGYSTLYLKLSKEQASQIGRAITCNVEASIAFISIYLGDKDKGYQPSISVKVKSIKMVPCEKKAREEDSDIDDDDE